MPVLNMQQARIPIGRTASGEDVFITVPWMKFMVQADARMGGTHGQSNDELAVDMHDDSGIEEIKIDQYRLRDELWQFPAQLQTQAPDADDNGRVQALEAEVAELRKQIDAINQGPEI